MGTAISMAYQRSCPREVGADTMSVFWQVGSLPWET